jgi:hypothetical protein
MSVAMKQRTNPFGLPMRTTDMNHVPRQRRGVAGSDSLAVNFFKQRATGGLETRDRESADGAGGQALIAVLPVERSAIEVLMDEHNALQALFARVSGVDEDRRDILKQLIQALSAHVGMEKQWLVPVVKSRAANGGVLAHHLSDYHDKAGRIMTRLDRRKVNSPDVPGLVIELFDLTDGHIVDANIALLPALSAALSAEDLAKLGTTMESNERQILTHPHPHLPDTGPLAKVSRWAASHIDHGRDNSTDVGRSST